jgi:hypothetical protein
VAVADLESAGNMQSTNYRICLFNTIIENRIKKIEFTLFILGGPIPGPGGP